MKTMRFMMIFLAGLLVGPAWGQSNPREPHIGYLYPAGGRQGTTFEMNAGGQFLRGVREVQVSGKGVHVEVVRHLRPIRPLDGMQRRLLQSKIRDRRAVLMSEARKAEIGKGKAAATPKPKPTPTPKAEDFPSTLTLPEHPLIENIDKLTLRGLYQLETELLPAMRRQVNPQISEVAMLRVTIDPQAAPGAREVRLVTPAGLTNPMIFQVGVLPERDEAEPNSGPVKVALEPVAPLEAPVTVNGQIMPGDVDRFRFKARKGEQVVLEVQARRLVPYLADAVPGWFQATLAVYDAKGREVGFADDDRFEPDPVLTCRIPADGEYEVEIRDSIYRGREDFVYRMTLIDGSDKGQRGVLATLRKSPWGNAAPRRPAGGVPEIGDSEPNSSAREAQPIELPRIINGRISEAGDVDIFRFAGKAGGEVVAEVFARRMNSPLDALLRITDGDGRVLAWNDDCVEQETGWLTHHADARATVKLPADGVYRVELSDAQRQGGQAFAYSLRISEPQPDFALRLTPSTLNVPAGRAAAVYVHAVRKDGFDGEIEVALKNAPPGFVVAGGKIPAGADRVRMTLAAPPKPTTQPIELQFEGRAVIAGQGVTRPAVPAEDMMQAFLYRHLVPSQALMVAVTGGRGRTPGVAESGEQRVRIPAGGTVEVPIKLASGTKPADVELVLADPPEGLTLREAAATTRGLTMVLAAAEGKAPAQRAGNLIVEAFRESDIKGPDGKPTGRKQKTSLGILPAIPYEITRQ